MASCKCPSGTSLRVLMGGSREVGGRTVCVILPFDVLIRWAALQQSPVAGTALNHLQMYPHLPQP
jgi:hypothetical protein